MPVRGSGEGVDGLGATGGGLGFTEDLVTVTGGRGLAGMLVLLRRLVVSTGEVASGDLDSAVVFPPLELLETEVLAGRSGAWGLVSEADSVLPAGLWLSAVLLLVLTTLAGSFTAERLSGVGLDRLSV